MKFKITAHRVGDIGIMCLPLCSNLPDADRKHPDWKRIQCPVCETECWESDQHRESLRKEPNMRKACTLCALKGGV